MIVLYLRAVVSLALLALAAAGAGRWIEPLLPKNSNAMDRISLVFLCGLGVLGTFLFVIGQFYFTRLFIAVVLAVAAPFGIAPIARLARSAFSLLSSKCLPVPKLPAIVIIFVLLVTAFAGLAEITGTWENDAVSYHLLAPKIWLRDGFIRPTPDNCHTAFPQTVETLFAALLAVGGDRAPDFSSVFTLALFLVIVAAMALRAGLGSQGTWWCTAIVAAMPAVYAGSHTGFIDAVYASFVLAAIRVAFDAQTPKEFAALGLFCGFAMGTKYTGLLAAPVVLLLVLFMRIKSADSTNRAVIKHLAIASAIACAVACPFYFRNWILLGSPLYPPPLLFFHFVHPRYMSAETVRQLQSYLWHRGEGLGRGPLSYLLLPYNLTYHTSRFHGAGGIGLAPLAFCPFALLLARRSRVTKAFFLLVFIFTTVWFIQQESRFLIPVYAVLAVLAVLGWRWLLATTGKSVRVLAAIVVALSIAYGCFMIASARQNDLHAVVSPSFAGELRREHIPFFESFEYLNHAPSVQKVLILDPSVPPYYLDHDYLKPFGTWGERLLPYASNAGDVLPHLQQLGISHILDISSSFAPFQVPRDHLGLELVLDLPNQRVYRVTF